MIETIQEQDSNYRELFVGSFEEATEIVVERDQIEEIPKFLLIDLDGTLFEDIMKCPFISTLIKPNIREETKEAFELLANTFTDRLAIATNRDSREDFIWNSMEMLNYMEKFISLRGKNIPIHERMQKQISRLFPKKIEGLVDYIAGSIFRNYGEDCNHIELNSIEDVSIVSFNRSSFLRNVGDKLYKKYGIRVNIKNYVIKK